MFQSFFDKNLNLGINDNIKKFLKNKIIYKEINFNTDINKKKSGKYIIDDKTRDLIFICDNLESVFNYKGYFLSDSNGLLEQNEVRFIPNILCNENKLYSSCYFSEVLPSSNDVLYFENILLDESQQLRISISNLDTSIFRYNFLNNFSCDKNFKQTILSAYLNYANRNEVRLIEVNLKNKNLIKWYSFKEKNTNYSNSLLDFKTSKVLYDKKEYYFSNNSREKNTLCIIVEYFNLNKEREFNTSPTNICIGKREGFIYLKPFSLKISCKILIFCKGKIDVEYYSSIINRWCKIDEIVHNIVNVEIRIRLSSFSRLRGIYFIN